MSTRNEIEAFHKFLTAGFAPHLEGTCEIQPPYDFRANWHRRGLNEEIQFHLFSKGMNQSFGLRTGGLRTPVVAAVAVSADWDAADRIWFSWREIWRRKAQDRFSLKEAAFTFFWGRPSLEGISNQLFRAEWPQQGEGGDTSAQPHWQVDWPLANLEHVVSGIHFGMAGWECDEMPADAASTHIARHWRRFAQNSIDILQTWATRTLEYSLDQIMNFYPKDYV